MKDLIKWTICFRKPLVALNNNYHFFLSMPCENK